MKNFKIDTDSGPLYKQVYALIRNKINHGEWEAGEQLPPETVLSKDLSVSRHTVRQAMNLLVNEGYLYRQAGKGTFVNTSKSNYPLTYLYSFTEQMTELGKKPSSEILEIETNVIPNDKLRERLSLSEHERLTKIYRLRLADGKPMSLEEVYINSKLTPGIENMNLESNSIYSILENEYNLNISDGEIILGAQKATLKQAKLLQVEEDSPVVYLDCLTFLENQRPAFLTFARYPYDRYVFTLNLPRMERE